MPNFVGPEIVNKMQECFVMGLSIRETQAAVANMPGAQGKTGVSRATVLNYLKRWSPESSDSLIEEYRRHVEPRPTSLTPLKYDQLVDIALTPKQDEQFYPVLLYRGNVSMGRAQALWNFSRALKAMNCSSIGDAVKFGQDSHDAAHLLGIHAKPQHLTVRTWLSRLWTTPDMFDLDPEMRDWLGDLAGGCPERFYFKLTKVPRYSTWKTTRAWRVGENTEGHRTGRRHISASVWPFITNVPDRSDDFLMEIDACVPKHLPEQVRQDVCQDLIVSVLSGEVSLPELQGAIKRHVSEVFKMHPLKYGPMSLDQPIPGANYRSENFEAPMKTWHNTLSTEN